MCWYLEGGGGAGRASEYLKSDKLARSQSGRLEELNVGNKLFV
jgi:hypothetical protein